MLWLYAILALSALIIIHEFGHYLCARAAGMHVDRFSVLGIGPVVLKLFEWKGTEFVISAIPFGAYVHIVGMEPEEDEKELAKREEEDPEGVAKEREARAAAAERAKEMGYKDFRDASMAGRVLAIFGGPLANYVTAMILAVGVFTFAGVPDSVSIDSFALTSKADDACLKVGDVLVSIAGESVQGPGPIGKVVAAGSAHPGEDVEVVVLRDGVEVKKTVPVSDEGRLGIGLAEVLEPTDAGSAIPRGLAYPFVTTVQQLAALSQVITRKSKQRMGGPVEIARVMKKRGEGGFAQFMLVCALISTALGMFNLLPLPALDGGRLMFLGYEAITGKRPNPEVEGWTHFIGMIALLGLIGYATVGDVKGAPFKAKLLAAMQAPEGADVCKDDVSQPADTPDDADPEATAEAKAANG